MKTVVMMTDKRRKMNTMKMPTRIEPMRNEEKINEIVMIPPQKKLLLYLLQYQAIFLKWMKREQKSREM